VSVTVLCSIFQFICSMKLYVHYKTVTSSRAARPRSDTSVCRKIKGRRFLVFGSFVMKGLNWSKNKYHANKMRHNVISNNPRIMLCSYFSAVKRVQMLKWGLLLSFRAQLQILQFFSHVTVGSLVLQWCACLKQQVRNNPARHICNFPATSMQLIPKN